MIASIIDSSIRTFAHELEDMDYRLQYHYEETEKLEQKRASTKHNLNKALSSRRASDRIITYFSVTGSVRRFVIKTGLLAIPIGDYILYEPFVLVTNTMGLGEVPAPVTKFLERNGHLLAGVAASGNRNWGVNYAKAADTIAKQYGVPILLKFEVSGTSEDVRIFEERMREIAETHRTEQ